MSAMRTSLSPDEQPFALVRRQSFADWFRQEARVSIERVSLENVPEMIMVRGADELSPAVAGAMAGAVAGPAMVVVATVLASRSHHAIDLPAMMAAMVAHAGHAPAASAHTLGDTLGGTLGCTLGWTMVVIAGAALGGLFALFTRRLRSFPAMIAFGGIASFALWTSFHGLLLMRVAPWLAKMLPYGPMVLGSIAAGLVLALQVPIRTRRVL